MLPVSADIVPPGLVVRLNLNYSLYICKINFQIGVHSYLLLLPSCLSFIVRTPQLVPFCNDVIVGFFWKRTLQSSSAMRV